MLLSLLACDAPDEAPPPEAAVVVADGVRTIAGCAVMPSDNVWNARVDGLPAVVDNDARMAWVADTFDRGLAAGACATVWEGSRCGLPWTVVGAETPVRTVTFAGPYVWGDASFPLPDDYRIEGEPNPAGAWDRHVLLVDADACVLHEIINLRTGLGGFYADGAARWDLASNGYAEEAWAGAEAAGIAMVPGIYAWEEVEAGEIPHALRILLPLVGDTYTWPAVHTDGRSSDPLAVPMGARLRLRADADLSGLGPAAAVIATALQTYGAIVADTTVNTWHVSGVPDERWDEADLDTLDALRPSDFEWVDVSGWAPADGSLAVGG